eukprot:8799559-Ditylum_brightwellii.AAC.1
MHLRAIAISALVVMLHATLATAHGDVALFRAMPARSMVFAALASNAIRLTLLRRLSPVVVTFFCFVLHFVLAFLFQRTLASYS